MDKATENIICFVAGLVLGLLLMWLISWVAMGVSADHVMNVVDECQSQLPRNQFCKLIAVPENDQTNK